MHGDFVWIDLSANNVKAATGFYKRVLNWSPDKNTSPYQIFQTEDEKPVSAIYEMPSFFKEKDMPSFWMSYIQVDDIYETADLAAKLGAKVELQQDTEYGNVALIRDPLGAGFTCYQGSAIKSTRSLINENKWVRSELFTSNIKPIKRFYEILFDWKITPEGTSDERFLIKNSKGTTISAIEVLAEDLRGDKQYWTVFFGTLDFSSSLKEVKKAGGECVFKYIGSDRKDHALIYDPQGSFFMLSSLLENPDAPLPEPNSAEEEPTAVKEKPNLPRPLSDPNHYIEKRSIAQNVIESPKTIAPPVEDYALETSEEPFYTEHIEAIAPEEEEIPEVSPTSPPSLSSKEEPSTFDEDRPSVYQTPISIVPAPASPKKKGKLKSFLGLF